MAFLPSGTHSFDLDIASPGQKVSFHLVDTDVFLIQLPQRVVLRFKDITRFIRNDV
jgi:hypothetical protein